MQGINWEVGRVKQDVTDQNSDVDTQDTLMAWPFFKKFF